MASQVLADKHIRQPIPWLAAALCLLISVLPGDVVLPGPLRGNGAPVRLIALIMVGLVILGFLTVRRTSVTRQWNPGVVILLFYLACNLFLYGLATLYNDSYEVSSNRTRAMVGLISQIGVGLFIILRVRGERDRRIVIGCLTAGLVFACLVGVLQELQVADLRYVLQPPGFTHNTALDEWSSADATRAGLARISATSQHPIEFSVLAASAVPLTIYLAVTTDKRLPRWLWWVGCLIAALALPVSLSRTGILAIIGALLLFMWAFPARQVVVAATVGISAVLAYAAVFPDVLDALWSTITGTQDDTSIASRAEGLRAVTEIFRNHPLVGIGLGRYDPTTYGYLDNQWLGTVAEGGLLGLLALITVTFGGFFGYAAALRRVQTRQQRLEVYALGAVYLCLVIASFTFDMFAFGQTAILFFIVNGLIWARVSVPIDDHRRASTPRARVTNDFPLRPTG